MPRIPTQVHGGVSHRFVTPVGCSRERFGTSSARDRNAGGAHREVVIKMAFPVTIDDVVNELIELTSDAGYMSDITVRTGEFMRARQQAAHVVAQDARAWQSVMQGLVARQFDEQVNAAIQALPQSATHGSTLANWRFAVGEARSAVVAADVETARVIEWAQMAEVEYREAADEAGGIAETFNRVCKAAGGWVRAAEEATARRPVQAVTLCVREVKAGLEEQVRPVEDLYATLKRRKAALFDALGEMFPPTQIYAAHPIVAERVTNGVRLCDTLERDLRVLVDDAGAAE